MENGFSSELPRVGFSIGEAGGVGPQLLLRFIEREGWQESFIPIVFGHRKVIERWRGFLGLQIMRYHLIRSPDEAKPNLLNLIECKEISDFSIGKPSKEGGSLARQSFVQAVKAAIAGAIDLLVTLPVDKTTFYSQEHFPYRGHTEYFRATFSEAFPLMVMVGNGLRVALLTEHIPLREVPLSLSENRIREGIRTLHQALRQDFAIQAPRIAVLGLNPHAGEGGLIGEEEERLLKPLIQSLWAEGLYVGGPFSPDGFFASRKHEEVDAILALYHDQGLIPFKILVGWEGYQYTAGLPFIRTSPDHGVAYDKAGTDEVDLSSLSAAVWEGLGLVRRRQAFQVQQS
ncbi:MAG: 4-hydroxythreonine-4-phosphate dehydrogenase PdxA [Bacteroidia bacterium]|nr:4-hydroxythreonine-4-phosphate dehydrogenase PdxA [Bacteroidia bacterium]MDW8015531.1 4-hydroxythreonine-4-phosphate dehydrogenase PdxA [Bacteroidia bacterium]